ncbi:MAG TPA: hypothetical protein VKU02_12680 [Gemmataceae bacterium]|nr:hypothetical protein [Gemmataceae bacterium]
MNGMFRLLICVAGIVLAGYVLEIAHPGWVPELATDLRNLPEIRSDLYGELELGGTLAEQMAVTGARTETKHRMLKALLDQRLTLVETATRFRDLDSALRGGAENRLRGVWPGRCDVERYCHQIIQISEWELFEQPSKAEAVVARLKTELQAAADAGAFGTTE